MRNLFNAAAISEKDLIRLSHSQKWPRQKQSDFAWLSKRQVLFSFHDHMDGSCEGVLIVAEAFKNFRCTKSCFLEPPSTKRKESAWCRRVVALYDSDDHGLCWQGRLVHRPWNFSLTQSNTTDWAVSLQFYPMTKVLCFLIATLLQWYKWHHSFNFEALFQKLI